MDQPIPVLWRIFLVIIPQQLHFPSSHLLWQNHCQAGTHKPTPPKPLSTASRGGKKSCLSIGKAEVKLQTFPTSNFFHSTLLSDPSLIISWAKREVGLTRTNTRTRFGDLRREAKMRKRRTLHSLNWNLYYLSAKGEAEESKIQNKVLAIIQLQFLFPIKNNCRQRAVEISCLEKWGCGMRRVKVILISWFPHVFQAQECW